MNDKKDTLGASDLCHTGADAVHGHAGLLGGERLHGEFIMRPRVDVCFKRLMEDEEVRIGFLSCILDIPPEEIKSAVLLPTGSLPEYGDDKLGILDVRVRLNDHREIDIEMQMNSHAWWTERSLFYLCRMYAGQLHEGDGYEKLQKCIHIGVLDFRLFDDETYHSRFHLWEDTRRQLYTDKLEVHVLELPKVKEGTYPESKLLYWAKFLNSDTKKEMEAMAVKDPYIEKAYRQVVKLSADEMARLEYEAREKAERDHDAYLKSSWLDGREEGIHIGRKSGIEIGLKTGRTEGIEIGRKSGIEIGRSESIRRVVRNMLKLNMQDQEIMELTDITIEQLNEIRESLSAK